MWFGIQSSGTERSSFCGEMLAISIQAKGARKTRLTNAAATWMKMRYRRDGRISSPPHRRVLASDRPHVDDREDGDEHHDQIGERCAVAEQLVGKRLLVRVEGDALRPVGRAAPRHHVDDVEDLEGLDRAQD